MALEDGTSDVAPDAADVAEDVAKPLLPDVPPKDDGNTLDEAAPEEATPEEATPEEAAPDVPANVLVEDVCGPLEVPPEDVPPASTWDSCDALHPVHARASMHNTVESFMVVLAGWVDTAVGELWTAAPAHANAARATARPDEGATHAHACEETWDCWPQCGSLS